MLQRGWAHLSRAIRFTPVILAVLVLIGPKAVWGDVLVTASHRVVSVTEVGDGTFEVSFDLTLTNEGTTSLTDVSLHFIPVYFEELVPSSTTLSLGAFSAGSTVRAQWTLVNAYPVSAAPDGRFLFFHGQGLDSFGETVAFSVTADEEAGP